jgi:hypothetical protein
VAVDGRKLRKLLEIEGYEDDVALIAGAVSDSVCPAFCMNEGCDYTAEMEPDRSRLVSSPPIP